MALFRWADSCYKPHMLEIRILGPLGCGTVRPSTSAYSGSERSWLLLAIHVGEVVPSQRLIGSGRDRPLSRLKLFEVPRRTGRYRYVRAA